ncbi:MAG: 2'-5' RNA ligase family protein [Anaerolineae bacterium]|nr:2'-5' RNA ligase family protein [Anaerolineae bacterium]
MHGIVSLLDDNHYRQVETLWAELQAAFDLTGIYAVPFPHFSYQVAAAYDLDRLEPLLAGVARQHPPLAVKTTGLGIFSGPKPVLYIAVVRSQALSQFHQAIWHSVSTTGSGLVEYYRPANWVPHITLANLDLGPDRLSAAVERLSHRDFSWEMTIDNLSLLYDSGQRLDLTWRLPLGA